jgi:hypothetical protein
MTKLNNGLRVASEKLYGDFCTVGVIVSAGPRFENPNLNGVTHFLEKLAFSVFDFKFLFLLRGFDCKFTIVFVLF